MPSIVIVITIVTAVVPTISAVLVRRVPGNGPVLELDDPTSDQVAESRKLGGAIVDPNQRLGDNDDLFIRDETGVDAPRDDEKSIILLGYDRWRSDLNACA